MGQGRVETSLEDSLAESWDFGTWLSSGLEEVRGEFGEEVFIALQGPLERAQGETREPEILGPIGKQSCRKCEILCRSQSYWQTQAPALSPKSLEEGGLAETTGTIHKQEVLS
jgi:hypothetical protein